MIQAILVEGLIHAVMDVGLDLALDQKPQATIDLTPVTAALEELSRQNRDIFSAVSRPTQTAGEEMYERAATAFSEGWYNDALGDAFKSIDLYPYSGKPRLVGGLAALALGKGDKGLELLRSAVKYSANGQPEVGAVAALVASHLALAVGGPNLARSLLEDADQIAAGRCPAIVGALWHHGDAARSSAEQRLKQLWWDDHKLPGGYSRSLFEEVLRTATAAEPDYLTAGEPFRRYLDEVAVLARSNLVAFDAVDAQLASFVTKRKASLTDSVVNEALSYVLSINPPLGFYANLGSVLAKCKSLRGAATWPGNDVWRSPNAGLYPSVVRVLFIYTRQACDQLLGALNQLPALATSSSRLAPDTRRAVKGALRHRNKWINALSAVRAAADVGVADQAVQAWDMFLGAGRAPGPEPVLHLEGLGGGLFTVIGGLPPALLPKQVPDTKQLSSVSMVSITCPGCHFPQRVLEGIKKTNCSQCGQEIVFRRCEKTNMTYPVLSKWKTWTHPGCKIKHRMKLA
jgi:tetratricopeptide (TPR) repeat protein